MMLPAEAAMTELEVRKEKVVSSMVAVGAARIATGNVVPSEILPPASTAAAMPIPTVW